MRFKILKLLVCLFALVPKVFIGINLASDGAPPDPVEYLQDQTGIWAYRFLLITLAISPLCRLTGWTVGLRFRRNLGVITFLYAGVHATSYLVFDQVLSGALIAQDLIDRPFILMGALAWLLLLPLALTSNNSMLKRLGAIRWRAIHKLVYVAVVLVSIHYVMLVKVDLVAPLVYALVVIFLLGARWRLPVRGIRKP